MKSRWLLLTCAVVGVGAWALAATGSPEIPRDPLAAAPAGSTVVARIDVQAVTASHLWRVLLEEDEDEEGVRRIERECGYDPLEQVEQVVVFVSGTDERPFEHVGFLARGEMARGRANRERLVACVGQVVGGRGAVQQVEIEGETAIASSSGGSHAAFLGEDGVVGGDREVVAQAIRVARGDAPASVTDPVLRRLWSRVSADRDVVAVAHLPSRWLPALRRMARDRESELAALATLRSVGVGLRLRDGLAVGVAAETDGAAGAERLAQLVETQVEGLLEDPLTRLSAIGRVARRLQVEAQGRELVLTVSLREADIDALLELWRELRAAGDDAPAPTPEEPAAGDDAPAPTPEEPAAPSEREPAPSQGEAAPEPAEAEPEPAEAEPAPSEPMPASATAP
jgi:hypothetical protein